MSIDRRIDQICDEFEACWTAGDRPSLFDFLKQAEGVDQVTLLHELLAIDIEYRNRLTMPVIAEEYAVFGQEAVQLAARVITELRSSRAQELRISESSDEDLTLLPKQTGFMDEAAFPSIAQRDEFATIPPKANAGTSTSLNAKVRYFGDYELLEEIARGGMGVVYKARQKNLNRIVALKMILAGQLASEEEVQRFRTEAEAAANLDHPGIVPIYEIGQHEGQHFFSMGYVDGCSLADRVRNGPLPPKEAAELTKRIAEAIAFAHSRNVIHRDLKPANVLLDQNGEPKVTDFGLARKTDTDSGMTRTGAVMGTPSYMPPEQAAGKTSEVGPLSDVYSLGAILYCLLTGRPPFQAANPLDTLLQVMEREPVSVSTINPEIQRDLETICHKALQKEPAKRYTSAQELAEDLGRWHRGEPIQARAVSTAERAYRWVKRNPVVSGLTGAIAIVILLGAGVSLIFGIAAEKEAANARASQANAELTLARSNYLLAEARWEQNRPRDAKELLARIPDRYRHIEWELAKNEFDGSEVTIGGFPDGFRAMQFSADGEWLIGVDRSNLTILNANNGTTLRTIKEEFGNLNATSNSCWGTGTFDISPDSRLIVQAVQRLAPNSTDHEVRTIDSLRLWGIVTGKLHREIEVGTSRVTSVAFSNDGMKVVAGVGEEVLINGVNMGGAKSIVVWDSRTAELISSLSVTNVPRDVQLSPDGRQVLTSEGGETLIRDLV